MSSAFTMWAGRYVYERPTKCIAAEFLNTSGNLDGEVREKRSIGATGGGDTLHGFISIDGKLVDVNTLLAAPDGWQITRTSAINEGRIAALACRIDNAYQCMPALLSPVPEPAAPVLWSAGLPLLASRWVLRRPSRRHAVNRRAV
jgi:hypothetical protein